MGQSDGKQRWFGLLAITVALVVGGWYVSRLSEPVTDAPVQPMSVDSIDRIADAAQDARGEEPSRDAGPHAHADAKVGEAANVPAIMRPRPFLAPTSKSVGHLAEPQGLGLHGNRQPPLEPQRQQNPAPER